MTPRQHKRIKPISRRKLLRGVLGGASVAVSLPLLESMLNSNGTALAAGDPLPCRFGVFFWGNGRGVRADRWTPANEGPDWTPSLELAPLANVKDYVSVVTGMTARMPNSPRGHHDGSVAILSGYDFVPQDPGNAPYRSTFGRPSIDQLAADVLGQSTPYRSLEVGISTRVIRGEGTTLQYLSHNGPDNANPPEFEPQALYERLFAADQVQTTPLAATLRELRASVLDGVRADLGDLQGRVGYSDRLRLQQHAEHIRSIERRLSSDAELAAQCTAATAPGGFDDDGGREPLAERMTAMGQLLALAMSCDLSRVFTIQFTGSVGYTVFWQVGLSQGHHDLSHQGDAAQKALEDSTVFTMEQFAGFLQTLRDMPDGDGNLLDRSVILATSDHSDGAAHSVNDYPVLIAGRGDGRLVHPGVHVRAERDHTNRILLTMLRSVGVDIPEIGEEDARQTESFSPIEV